MKNITYLRSLILVAIISQPLLHQTALAQDRSNTRHATEEVVESTPASPKPEKSKKQKKKERKCPPTVQEVMRKGPFAKGWFKFVKRRKQMKRAIKKRKKTKD